LLESCDTSSSAKHQSAEPSEQNTERNQKGGAIKHPTLPFFGVLNLHIFLIVHRTTACGLIDEPRKNIPNVVLISLG
jgi:hypothetical protein